MQPLAETKQAWRDVLTVEASAIRTAAAVVGPLLVGQMVGQEAAGLVIGLGALYVCLADKFAISLPLLLLTTLGAMSAVLAGSAVAANAPLDIALMACWAFGFGLLAAYGELAAQLGFVLTLVFAVAQGLATVSPADQWQRALLFGGGGLIAVLATAVLRRVSPPLSPPPEPPTFAPLGALRPHLTPASQILWHAVRLNPCRDRCRGDSKTPAVGPRALDCDYGTGHCQARLYGNQQTRRGAGVGVGRRRNCRDSAGGLSAEHGQS